MKNCSTQKQIVFLKTLYTSEGYLGYYDGKAALFLRFYPVKKTFIALMVLALNSCATVKTPIPISGSKSDGTVTLAYQYGAFEEPVIDWNSANAKAKERCKAWGYHNAQPFGGNQSSCVTYNQYGCVQEQVNIMYQCS